ncbi:hypothetical protein RUE5091_00544 [Ruegeria denitrificans]|uniref:Uncharacterized protein n=1 Tax=Ruegeria denitrificans TaxID=1715692 RepID=A0A0P1IF71_9RHOB|nr:hypothetical protein RUE5091_00544 [Ruegeria denitrificans]
MNQTSFISPLSADSSAAVKMRVRRNNKGGESAADAVYTNAPTQTQFAQADGLRNTRGKRNTHGVRTNG